MRVLNAKYRREHPEKAKLWDRKRCEKTKLRALLLVGPAQCVICGCDDLELLELNLKSGGHNKLARENKLSRGKRLYRDIINGLVDTSLFDIRCKVCNAVHYVKMKFGLDYSIVWVHG